MIAPDTKNWTWVLEEACPECGFDAKNFPRDRVASEFRTNGSRWAELLNQPDTATRTDPGKWSVLEYACHCRDVNRLALYRIDLILKQDDPSFKSWDQDEAALSDNYASQNPALVSRELRGSADELAARIDSVTDPEWGREGNRDDGSVFTVESIARYMLHDVVHHVWDVRPAERAPTYI